MRAARGRQNKLLCTFSTWRCAFAGNSAQRAANVNFAGGTRRWNDVLSSLRRRNGGTANVAALAALWRVPPV